MNALYRVLALLVLVCALPAQATNLELQVVERTSGRPLPTYRHHGDIYVEGQAGQAFALDLINRSGQRVLAVTSIDGVNVVTGETAAFDQPGYVLDPGERLRLEGWRKNLTQVASFHFTTQHASYAGRTGRPGQVGVIGVAVFAEKAPPCCRPPPWRRGQASAAEPDKRAEAGASRDALASRPGGSTLGTGHGERHSSRARYTSFERASQRPVTVTRLFYDSHANLLARGVIPPPPPPPRPLPEPFPAAGFVPDP